MNKGNVLNFPTVKLVEEDFTVEFEIKIHEEVGGIDENDKRKLEIDQKLYELDGMISTNEQQVEELNTEIDRLTNHSDGLDYMVAVGSGILAGIVDSLWVGEFKMDRGKAWSNETVNKFVMKVAKLKGYEGERLNGAIKFLEDKFHIPTDNIWKGENVGISAKSHHLDDLAHHPTPLGLFFSILTQFTKKGYFQNGSGDFLPITVDEKGMELIGGNIPSKIFAGTVNWFLHLVSDMSGSNKTAGAGMGIPGPIVSLLKEISMIPGLDKSGLAAKIKEVFVKEKFDLRSELAVGYELGRQAIPVVINEVIVRAFYFIRRLVAELKEKQSLKAMEWKNTLPWRNRTIVRMLTIATGTFTLVDLGDAAIRGGLKSGGNPALFAKEFILRVNFVGVGRFAIAVSTDLTMGVQRGNRRNERITVLSEQLHLLNARIHYMQADTWITAAKTEEAIHEVYGMMEDTTRYFVASMEANKQSLHMIGEYKKEIAKHNPDLFEDIQDLLLWGE